MPAKHVDPASSSNGQPDAQQPDPRLVEAVNQLVWLIADEVVEATQEACVEAMLPEPKRPSARTAGRT